MSRIATFAAFATLATAALLAQAQTSAPQQVQILGTSAAASAAQTAELRGRYELSDGRVLELSAQGRQVVANLDAAPTVALRALGAGLYASADGRMRVQLQQHANGTVSGLVLTEWRGDALVRTASR
jgi:hypothetical protein